MSVSVPPLPAGSSPDPCEPAWQSGLTPKEAARLGIAKAVYLRLVIWARMVVDHHVRAGTPRHLWEGAATHNDLFAAPYVADGERELADRLGAEVDPALDEAQDCAEDAEEEFDEAARHPFPITSPEAGCIYSGAEAVEVVTAHDATITAHRRVGKQHDRRVRRWVAVAGRWFPWLEALGLLGFVAYFLNVPLLRPWADWLGFTLGVTIVGVVIYGQTRLAHEGAVKHNAAREAAADGHRHEAERAYQRRNVYVGLAVVVALGITVGLVLRGTAVLGDAGPVVVGLLVFLAVLAGLLMPLVSYLSVALDGSTVSRERDSLAADLDVDLDAFEDTTEGCRRELAHIAEVRDTLRDKVLPNICNDVQRIVDAAHPPYTTARLLIGGLTADPPVRTSRIIARSADGRVTGEIGTGLPGARTVDLAPLLDRMARLKELDDRRRELDRRLRQLPQHPWAKSHPVR